MPDYRRHRLAGGTYFFTVNLLERYPTGLLVRHIEYLDVGERGHKSTMMGSDAVFIRRNTLRYAPLLRPTVWLRRG